MTFKKTMRHHSRAVKDDHIAGRTIFTVDNLFVMRGMRVGSKAAGAAFKDTWTLDDVDDAWCRWCKTDE